MRTFLAATELFLSVSAPVLAQTVVPALPKEILGIWGFEDAESCDNKDSDTRMTARAREVEFYASAYQLRKIWRRADGTVKATATTSEEGEQGADAGRSN